MTGRPRRRLVRTPSVPEYERLTLEARRLAAEAVAETIDQHRARVARVECARAADETALAARLPPGARTRWLAARMLPGVRARWPDTPEAQMARREAALTEVYGGSHGAQWAA
jgi:hypothetical protein